MTRQQQVINVVRHHPEGITSQEVARELDISTAVASLHLSRSFWWGKITRRGIHAHLMIWLPLLAAS